MILGPREQLGTEHRRTWAAARVWAAHQVPYMASALLALDPVVVDQSDAPPDQRLDLTALPVDECWHIYLDPDVLGTMDVPTVGFWLVHQVSHLLRDHAQRSPVRDPEGTVGPAAQRTQGQRRWNLATDAEINDDLVAGEAVKPAAAITPSALRLPDSLTAEEYWVALSGREQEHGQPERSGSDRRLRLWQRL